MARKRVSMPRRYKASWTAGAGEGAHYSGFMRKRAAGQCHSGAQEEKRCRHRSPQLLARVRMRLMDLLHNCSLASS